MKGLLFVASGFVAGLLVLGNVVLGGAYIYPIGDAALRSLGDQVVCMDGNTGRVTKVQGPDPWSLLGRSIAHRASGQKASFASLKSTQN